MTRFKEGSKKQQLYEVWKRDKNFNRKQIANDIGMDERLIYRYLKTFKRINESEIKREPEESFVATTRTEDEFISILKSRKEIDLFDLCDQLSIPPNQVHDLISYYQSKGFEIAILNDNRIILSDEVTSDIPVDLKTFADREITIGIATDLHIGSKACQLTALNKFGEDCKKNGVEDILCPGDVLAGFRVYPGQEFDLYCFEADEQEDSAVANIPKGFRWWMLGGNHDYSFIKSGGGHNCIRALAAKREDFNYLGFDQVIVPLLNGVDAMLWHPSGAIPYALSYRIQKGMENAAYGELQKVISGIKEKPTLRFLFAGHLHIQMQAMFGAIFGAQCGAFEGTNNLIKRRGYTPNIGGYILNAVLDSRGMLKEHTATFYHYREIFDDYKNYKHKPSEKEKIEKPILQ